MTALGIVCGTVGGWCVLAALGCTVPHRLRQYREAARQPIPEPVNWIPVLPEVPPTRSELAWMRSQPALSLDPRDVRALFNDVVAGGWR